MYQNAKTRFIMPGDNADEPIHPDTRRGRFIVPIADLSASVDIPISGLFSKCALSCRAINRVLLRYGLDRMLACELQGVRRLRMLAR